MTSSGYVSDVAINVEGLGKQERATDAEYIWALRDVVRGATGEVLGVI